MLKKSTMALAMLIENPGMTAEEIANQFGLSRAYVYQCPILATAMRFIRESGKQDRRELHSKDEKSELARTLSQRQRKGKYSKGTHLTKKDRQRKRQGGSQITEPQS